MTRIVNMHEAKTQLSKLVAAVADGEEVVIAKAGKPVAKIVAYEAKGPRKLGGWEGQVWIAGDFDDLDEEIVEVFEGGDI